MHVGQQDSKNARREQIMSLRERIHALLQDSGQSLPHFYRMEWFQEHHSSAPQHSIGYVKFDFVVGCEPLAVRPFSVHIGYAIIRPRVAAARGFYQDYGWHPCVVRKTFDDSIHYACNILADTQISIESIEEALARTLALHRQPYQQHEYEADILERKLSEFCEDGISCIASAPFFNPLHPHLAYGLVAQKQEDGVVLHCIGRRGEEIADIRIFNGAGIGEVVDSFHDSLSHSYISPEELAGAISRFQPRDVVL